MLTVPDAPNEALELSVRSTILMTKLTKHRSSTGTIRAKVLHPCEIKYQTKGFTQFARQVSCRNLSCMNLTWSVITLLLTVWIQFSTRRLRRRSKALGELHKAPR